MITDYVSFPTAKLLREAGYPQTESEQARYAHEFLNARFDEIDGERLCIPHLWDAMSWVRNEKGINLLPYRKSWLTLWQCRIDCPNGKQRFANGKPHCVAGFAEPYGWGFDNYEQALDYGIAGACEWLINNQK